MPYRVAKLREPIIAPIRHRGDEALGPWWCSLKEAILLLLFTRELPYHCTNLERRAPATGMNTSIIMTVMRGGIIAWKEGACVP